MDTCLTRPSGGFDFENVLRNQNLEALGYKAPIATKTGTTICGIIFKDGVILGADTRATGGSIVMDKNCAKIHYIAPNIYCCGAGTAADTENTTNMISSQLELHRLRTGRKSRVTTANKLLKQMLYKYGGQVSAALVLGGMDINGPALYSIYPHGSTDKLPYVTMGSGSLAAMGVFEDRWKPDMTREEGCELVKDAIRAGIFNDLGSGSNVDVCVITKDEVKYIRPYEVANEKGARQNTYTYAKGTTATVGDANVEIISETTTPAASAMDTSA